MLHKKAKTIPIINGIIAKILKYKLILINSFLIKSSKIIDKIPIKQYVKKNLIFRLFNLFFKIMITIHNRKKPVRIN